MNTQKLLGAILIAATYASAHLNPVTNPKASQSLEAGSMVMITWSVDQPHNNQDLAYSTDGKTWTNITTDLGKSATSFNWKVPSTPSTTVRVRVCQKENIGGTVTGCTDNENTQNLSAGKQVTGGKIYTAITGNFTIQGGTGVRAAKAAARTGRPMLNASSNKVEASFNLENSSRVLLQAFDAQGRLVATLMDENRAGGPQSISVPAEDFGGNRATVYRLQTAEQVLQKAGSPSR